MGAKPPKEHFHLMNFIKNGPGSMENPTTSGPLEKIIFSLSGPPVLPPPPPCLVYFAPLHISGVETTGVCESTGQGMHFMS